MAVGKLVLLGCLVVVAAQQTSDAYASEALDQTPPAFQGFTRDAGAPWTKDHSRHRTRRGIKRGDGHVITSYKHIPGKALNVASRIVSRITARDCAVYCVYISCKAWSHNNATNECRFVGVDDDYVAVPVVQPYSDYYEISAEALGAALYEILLGGLSDHDISVEDSQVRTIEDPRSPENVLTDHLEPLPPPTPTPTPSPSPSPSPATAPPGQPATDAPTPAPTVPPTDSPTPAPDLSYQFDFPDYCGTRPTFGLSDYERLLAPPGQMERTRVVGGTTVATGTYPWQAQIQISNNRGYEHSCGGIVISEDLILTAAHCHTKHESNYQVRVAQNDLQDPDDPDERVLAVENVYRHSGHRPDLRQGQRNDIAMMRLKFRRGEPHGLRFSDYIQPLCLPRQNTTLVVGQECQISGWGLVDANHPRSAEYVSRYLKGAVINVLDPALCYKAYGERFDERLMICAGRKEGGVDTCSGDSGGPLSCRDEFGRWFAAGIVSFGWECGAAGHPGVYTRVTAYLEFLHRTAAFLTGVPVV